jgi:hypothetical protein
MLKNAGYGFAEAYSRAKLSLEDIRLSYGLNMHYSTIEVTIPPALANVYPYLVELTATHLLQCLSVIEKTVRPFISLALMVVIAVS